MANTSAPVLQDNPDFLKGALLSVERKFVAGLKHVVSTNSHNGAHGDATESAWLKLLEEYLPGRYRVAKAFAVDHKGNTTKQLDCIVYDAHFTPKLFGEDSSLYVPAEAVYATFEIKQSVDVSALEDAAEKAASLRRLTRTSTSLIGPSGVPNPVRSPFPIVGGLLAMNASWADGLGRAFRENLQTYAGDQALDFVLTAESGFYDALDSVNSPDVVTGEGSLIRGLFRLIRVLRDKNTVTPIDWKEYEKVLER